ncbi:MAG: oligosaccharide flippase family protein [Candidatus Methanofastidiosum sp.]|nr:oligosaccharide flippase family protein [Methanofastidiosum sp.]
MQLKFDESGLLKHGIIMFVSLIVARFFGYLFQIYVARSLGPEEYGVFGSLFSLFLILTVPTGTIQTVISRFTSEYKVKHDPELINSLLSISSKKMSFFGIMACGIMIIFSMPLSRFLHIGSLWPVIIIGISVFWSFILPIPQGILQGLQKFNWFGTFVILQTLSRFIMAIIFFSFGFGLNGILASFSISPLFLLPIYFIPLQRIIKYKAKKINLNKKQIYNYSYSILIFTSISLLFQQVNILFVKHFFSSEQTGIYLVALQIGMIILYLTPAITTSMFPKVSDLDESKERSKHIVYQSLLYVGLFALIFVTFCFLFDGEITLLLFGQDYFESSKLLPLLSLAMSFLSLGLVMFSYLVAVKKFNFLKIISIVLVFHVCLLILFNSTIFQTINILLFTNLFLFLIGLIYIYRS